MRTIFAVALLAVGCGGQISSGPIEGAPADPGLTYEAEPDSWQEAPGVVDDGAPPFGTESCRLHSYMAYGNYTRLTPYQVAALAHRAGVPCGHGLVEAVAVAAAESGRYQYATLLNTNCSLDRGLWQINSGYWGRYSRYDLPTNSHGMAVISSRGSNWQPWVTYDIGAQRKFLGNACTAVRALCGAHTGC